MGLKLAAKKSYHPGKETNKARVARDEQLEEESRDQKAESERVDRFSLLRAKAGLADEALVKVTEVQSVGSLQTFSKVVDPEPKAKKSFNKGMDPELVKAKMDPMADIQRFLQETEEWESVGEEQEVEDKVRSRDRERSVRRHGSRRKKRSHRVSKD